MPDIFSKNQLNTTAPQPKIVSTTSEQTVLKPIHLFTTYCQNPRGISFAEQENDETIILFLRRDFITNTPWIIATVALIFIPSLIRFIFVSTNFSLFSLPETISLILLGFYYIIVVGFVFANLSSWFYNIGLITNKRGVDIDFINLATINVATSSLPDIKDAEYTQAGFAQSFFDYGDVRLRIEATGEVFVFEKVPRPTEVAGILSKLIGRQTA
ncbi:MAG TPA: hypothetical protein VNW29_02610 [Candidatus Sulfotelmatobacter sp.]|jgi:hypothetical protein|nr:hypothetical protein [Candidatus Sulfotelmatobacter sp.]